ncbi:MAG: HAMP domain-containing protein [Cyanobacteria bacterium SID2]|nr:HAMP domain-containing protein [Cyanobacteria bacterium SID2]
MGEARTRILLLYVVLMLALTALSVPIFHFLMLRSVEIRVRENLLAERDDFFDAYQEWQDVSEPSLDSLQAFADSWLANVRTEDDNFHIILIDDRLYRSTPMALPEPLQPNSELYDRWRSISEFTRGEYKVDDPEIGSIFFKADPLEVGGNRRGVFAIAHTSGGEIQEVLSLVNIFVTVAVGIVVLSFVLAWLAMGTLLAPVKQLAETARSIGESDLTQRLVARGTGELAELAIAFNAMMDRIQAAFDSQRNFINDAGHELRTPLTIVRGYLEVMGDTPQERREAISIALDELDRMNRTIEDMTLLAKSERPDFLQLETIDLERFTRTLYTKAQALADRDWQLHGLARGQMVGDRQQLTAALLNLLKNAAQYTQPSDVIEFGSNRRLKTVKFWVRDTGEGIPPEHQARIFDRFARAPNTYRRSEGSGLGLAIVRAIAEAHGGYIELSSQIGSGSMFALVVPFDPPRSQGFDESHFNC